MRSDFPLYTKTERKAHDGLGTPLMFIGFGIGLAYSWIGVECNIDDCNPIERTFTLDYNNNIGLVLGFLYLGFAENSKATIGVLFVFQFGWGFFVHCIWFLLCVKERQQSGEIHKRPSKPVKTLKKMPVWWSKLPPYRGAKAWYMPTTAAPTTTLSPFTLQMSLCRATTFSSHPQSRAHEHRRTPPSRSVKEAIYNPQPTAICLAEFRVATRESWLPARRYASSFQTGYGLQNKPNHKMNDTTSVLGGK